MKMVTEFLIPYDGDEYQVCVSVDAIVPVPYFGADVTVEGIGKRNVFSVVRSDVTVDIPSNTVTQKLYCVIM